MSATIRQIVDDALTAVGEISGAGVESYSDDKMFADTIRGFNMLFKKYPWDQYLNWFTVTLDGTTGKITTNAFANVRDFEDIIDVYRDGQNCAMPVLPLKYNPSVLTGTNPMYWASLPATDADYTLRKIRVWPKTSIGVLNIQARVYPRDQVTPWDWEDVIDLDKDMLVHATAFMTLLSDETNASAAEGQKMLMEDRFATIKSLLTDRPIPAGGSNSGIPMQWFPR